MVAAVLQCGAHAGAAFLHGIVGEPHHDEEWVALGIELFEVHFYKYAGGLQTVDGDTVYGG